MKNYQQLICYSRNRINLIFKQISTCSIALFEKICPPNLGILLSKALLINCNFQVDPSPNDQKLEEIKFLVWFSNIT